MSALSTFNQTISTENGINGNTLKDQFLADMIITKKTDKDVFQFVERNSYVNFDCFYNPDYNIFDYCIFGDGDFIKSNEGYALKISRKYPDTVFHYHSSYCPGGCGERVTCNDFYVKAGKILQVKEKRMGKIDECGIILGTFDVDVKLQPNGKFEVYISHAGSSGEHYIDVTADRIGELVAEDIEVVAEPYQQ